MWFAKDDITEMSLYYGMGKASAGKNGVNEPKSIVRSPVPSRRC